jgi:glycosyltransferase involved in cell wall biosynthesis
LQELEKVASEEADQLIAVSERLADEAEEEFGRRPEVIHNGFSVPEKTGIDVKKDLGIEDDMVFFVGRHSEQKGIEHLLYGFRKLLDDRDVELVIGGKGHMTEVLKDFAEMLEVEDSVHFPGYIPGKQLGDYYTAADVFVSPSINEPFGLTITEALETGTPVVATGSGVEEIASESIVSVEPNSDSLKQGVIEALEQDKEIDPKSRSWSEMAEETIKLYEKLG